MGHRSRRKGSHVQSTVRSIYWKTPAAAKSLADVKLAGVRGAEPARGACLRKAGVEGRGPTPGGGNVILVLRRAIWAADTDLVIICRKTKKMIIEVR